MLQTSTKFDLESRAISQKTTWITAPSGLPWMVVDKARVLPTALNIGNVRFSPITSVHGNEPYMPSKPHPNDACG